VAQELSLLSFVTNQAVVSGFEEMARYLEE
jgi:hypothetical protein